MNAPVYALAVPPNGNLVAGGLFTIVNGAVSAYLAGLATTCPATAAASGTACPGSGGANTYAALNLPWTGSVYRTRGTGLASPAFVAVVSGFTAISLPLAGILPSAPPGCSLFASPDIVDFTFSSAGTVDTQVVVPNSPTLAGIVLHQQLVVLEVDAGLAFVQTTSTNAVVATVGSF
jgi:hypothetical protein